MRYLWIISAVALNLCPIHIGLIVQTMGNYSWVYGLSRVMAHATLALIPRHSCGYNIITLSSLLYYCSTGCYNRPRLLGHRINRGRLILFITISHVRYLSCYYNYRTFDIFHTIVFMPRSIFFVFYFITNTYNNMWVIDNIEMDSMYRIIIIVIDGILEIEAK